MNSLKDHIKSLESEIRYLRKEIKEKITLISSDFIKNVRKQICEANNFQNSNNKTSCLQEQGKEIASGNAPGKNVKEVFVEKTKSTENIKTASLSHSTKPGNSNSNIRNRVNKMGDSISRQKRQKKCYYFRRQHNQTCQWLRHSRKFE